MQQQHLKYHHVCVSSPGCDFCTVRWRGPRGTCSHSACLQGRNPELGKPSSLLKGTDHTCPLFQRETVSVFQDSKPASYLLQLQTLSLFQVVFYKKHPWKYSLEQKKIVLLLVQCAEMQDSTHGAVEEKLHISIPILPCPNSL